MKRPYLVTWRSELNEDHSLTVWAEGPLAAVLVATAANPGGRRWKVRTAPAATEVWTTTAPN